MDPKWVAWGLRAYERELLRKTRKAGTTVASIEWPRFRAFGLPLPGLDEQRRIVDILEDRLARLDAALAALTAVKRRSAVLMRSGLQRGLRGGLAQDDVSEGTAHYLTEGAPVFEQAKDDRVWPIPASWVWKRLGDIFEVNVGATPPRSVAEYWNGDLPWVSSGEVAFGRISITRERINRLAAGNPRRRIHPPGTVLPAMIGEGKTRGQAALLDIEAAHNQNCASIRVSQTQVLPEYIYGYLEERYLETRRGGAGGQQLALNKAAIERFPVPIAPLGTQRRLVEMWAAMRSECSRIDSAVDRATARCATLRRGLLESAFSGQLAGPQLRGSLDLETA